MAEHIIQNFTELASTPLRRDALTILEAGLEAVETKAAVNRIVSLTGSQLQVGQKTYNLAQYQRILVVGMGKASLDAATALEEILGDRINDGIVIDTRSKTLPHIRVYAGSHPLPSEQNIEFTSEAISLLESATAQDLVITVISGGGSALFSQPYNLSVEQLADITHALMKKGAPISDVNLVRKHLSQVHGGQLVKIASPATVVGLIFSDIPNNDASLVASGPTFLDSSTIDQAREVLNHYGINPPSGTEWQLLETPKDPVLFESVHNELVVSNQHAADAMVAKAQELKYSPRLYSTNLQGEAREIGTKFAQESFENEAVIACGETTVNVIGDGCGGRNQELALGALMHLLPNTLVLSCASDGVDNSTQAAGAIADEQALAQANELGLDPLQYLAANDSHSFFSKIKTTIITGKTGINVADIIISLRRNQSAA